MSERQQGVQDVSFGAKFDSSKFFEDRGPEDDSQEPGKGEENEESKSLDDDSDLEGFNFFGAPFRKKTINELYGEELFEALTKEHSLTTEQWASLAGPWINGPGKAMFGVNISLTPLGSTQQVCMWPLHGLKNT